MIRSSTVTVCDRIPQHTVYSYVNCDKANRVSPFFKSVYVCLRTTIAFGVEKQQKCFRGSCDWLVGHL